MDLNRIQLKFSFTQNNKYINMFNMLMFLMVEIHLRIIVYILFR